MTIEYEIFLQLLFLFYYTFYVQNTGTKIKFVNVLLSPQFLLKRRRYPILN